MIQEADSAFWIEKIWILIRNGWWDGEGGLQLHLAASHIGGRNIVSMGHID
jgi:hypothetical protein